MSGYFNFSFTLQEGANSPNWIFPNVIMDFKTSPRAPAVSYRTAENYKDEMKRKRKSK